MKNGIKRVAVIGSGTMGPGIAQVLAIAGAEVCLYDISQESLNRAKSNIYSSLQTSADMNIIEATEVDKLFKKISYTMELKKAIENVDMVVEAIVENANIKKELYRQLDALLPEDIIIASNTSFLNIFELMPDSRLPYTVITHWYSPPTMIPLVEVCPNEKTKEGIIETVCDLLEMGGKNPVVMKKFIQGYIINRIQMCINQEVYYLLDNGYCTAQDIDTALKSSFIPRAMVLGVLQKTDFGGLNMTANNYKNKIYSMPPEVDIPKVLAEHIEKGETGVVAGKGYYDYTGKNLNELYEKRDKQLYEAFKLQKELMEDPL